MQTVDIVREIRAEMTKIIDNFNPVITDETLSYLTTIDFYCDNSKFNPKIHELILETAIYPYLQDCTFVYPTDNEQVADNVARLQGCFSQMYVNLMFELIIKLCAVALDSMNCTGTKESTIQENNREYEN